MGQTSKMICKLRLALCDTAGDPLPGFDPVVFEQWELQGYADDPFGNLSFSIANTAQIQFDAPSMPGKFETKFIQIATEDARPFGLIEIKPQTLTAGKSIAFRPGGLRLWG